LYIVSFCNLISSILVIAEKTRLCHKQANRHQFMMNLQWWKYRGMQALKTEDEDESSLPPSFPKKQSPSRPWLLPTACTLLFVLSAISFNMRWSRPILQAPIELPPRSYMFEDHPELRPFDQETTELWRPFGKEHWWSMEWMDPSGHRLTAGIDMLHKLHCLMAVRDEFTLMATDPDRRTVFNAKTAESTTRRMHVKHCLDFIRQV
jgi:hypothetical protein